MNAFKYQLDRTARKFHCPQCHKKTFVRMRDQVTGQYLAAHFGRCDREIKCGYFERPNTPPGTAVVNLPAKSELPAVYIPQSVLMETLQDYENNVFLNNLHRRGVPEVDLTRLVQDYYLGTVKSGDYAGGITFPFIDERARVQAIQIKTFSAENKTLKTNWIHTLLRKTDPNPPDWLTAYLKTEKKINCLFGAHLISRHPQRPVIVVESPKNALTGSLFMPEFIWLAAGALGYLQTSKFLPLVGRKIILIPDTSTGEVAFEQWQYRAAQINRELGTRIRVIRYLDNVATAEQKAAGYDIADYFFQSTNAPPLQDLPALAAAVIGEFNHQTPQQIISALTALNQPEPERAFAEMQAQKIITRCHLGTYYLTNSAPF